jgi:hypothetical protein
LTASRAGQVANQIIEAGHRLPVEGRDHVATHPHISVFNFDLPVATVQTGLKGEKIDVQPGIYNFTASLAGFGSAKPQR